MQRHHGALAETDEAKRPGRQLVALQLGVEKSLEHRRRFVDAEPALIGIAEGERKPLPPDRRLSARLRRVRRDERRLRQILLPGAADVDEVVAVGAIAVQEHDKLLRGAGARRQPRAVKLSGHSRLVSATPSLPSRACRGG
jgi:hypothetical protein